MTGLIIKQYFCNISNLGNIFIAENTVYDKGGLRIDFSAEKAQDAPNTTIVNVKAYNTTTTDFTEFVFQAAVPKVRCSKFYD